jgi:hypothetical protein
VPVLRSLPPVQPGPGALTLIEKLTLGGEILVAYAPALRRIRRSDVRGMTAWARDCRASPASPPADDARRTAIRLGRIVRRVLALLPTDSRCLVTSLVLARLLTRRSVDHALVIGVLPGQSFGAHAWVEHAGRPVLPAGRFERLLEL